MIKRGKKYMPNSVLFIRGSIEKRCKNYIFRFAFIGRIRKSRI
jgi:hypothetical protein